MKTFTKKNSSTRHMLFQNGCSNFLQQKYIFDEVTILIYLGIVKDSSDYF